MYRVLLQVAFSLYSYFFQGGGIKLAYQGRYYPDTVEGLVAMNLTEDNWRYLSDPGLPLEDHPRGDVDVLVAREDFLMVLAQLERLLIRGTYHVYQTRNQYVL